MTGVGNATDAAATLGGVSPALPVAAIALRFDPLVHVGDRGIRADTLLIGTTALAALLLVAMLARATPPDRLGRRVRSDDLLFIALGSVPGAVVGARLGYGLLHLAFYQADPAALLDPSQGGLELTGGVIGGLVTGAYVSGLLDAPVGRWAHVAALPLLFAIAGGKIAMAVGGSGQGRPLDAAWATAYLGPGPWGSLGPAVPSHPSQLYEAVVALVVLVVCLALVAGGQFRRRTGRLLVVALGGWMLGRFAVAFTWRDETLLGPLRAEQLILVAGLLGLGAAWILLGRRSSSRSQEPAGPDWPDPETARQWRRVGPPG